MKPPGDHCGLTYLNAMFLFAFIGSGQTKTLVNMHIHPNTHIWFNQKDTFRSIGEKFLKCCNTNSLPLSSQSWYCREKATYQWAHIFAQGTAKQALSEFRCMLMKTACSETVTRLQIIHFHWYKITKVILPLIQLTSDSTNLKSWWLTLVFVSLVRPSPSLLILILSSC